MDHAVTLFVFSGMPGAGKSTIARRLAKEAGAFWLRIDSFEQAIRDADVLRDGVGAAGYLAAHAVAADNLGLGRTVVADCANPWMLTRDGWRDVGKAAGVPVVEIEIVCSDALEHQRRLQARKAAIIEPRPSAGEDLIDPDYRPWDREHLVIDTANISVDACAELIRALAPHASLGVSDEVGLLKATRP